MKEGIKKITACLMIILMTITLTPIYKVTHKVSAAQNFKIHFIDVGCADGALLQYGEGSKRQICNDRYRSWKIQRNERQDNNAKKKIQLMSILKNWCKAFGI